MDSSSEIKDRKMENGERELPVMAVGDALELLELLPSQHFTEPPARFTEASLIKALEEYGIGRPSTYAPIISTIQERQYVEKMEKKFQPTNLGLAVNDFLLANFTDIMDYQFTAGMEDKLDDIANGERPWRPVVADFYGPFAQKLSTVQETAERVKVAAEETSETCPQCQAPLVVRLGRFGKFLACSKFPACKFTKPYQQKINMKCPGCGTGDIIIRRTRSRKSFYGCSRYPECDFASWTKPKVQDEKRQDSNNGQASYEGKDKTI
jgi:DNA topoisomerase-1